MGKDLRGVAEKQVVRSSGILLTERGVAWLKQFHAEDREIAERLVNSLTLVSHTEFERALVRLIISKANSLTGPVALYAAREMDPTKSFFEQASVQSVSGKQLISAVEPGTDLGSEARVATIIRSIVKSEPGKYLNHPDVASMRAAKCRAIFVIDDFIGSGGRTSDYLNALGQDGSVRSWHSHKKKYIKFYVIAYSGTQRGMNKVRRLRLWPEVEVVRECPTYFGMPWRKGILDDVKKLCERYGRLTSKKHMVLGYGDTMAALIFEHGSPNNVPAIFWAPQKREKHWMPLFPDRTILPPEASAFPEGIVRRDASTIVRDFGDARLARSGALSRRGKVGETVLVVLALIAKGLRQGSALAYATSLSTHDAVRVLDRCVKWGLLTPTHRITAAGSAELGHARKFRKGSPLPPQWEDDYYPIQLREATRG